MMNSETAVFLAPYLIAALVLVLLLSSLAQVRKARKEVTQLRSSLELSLDNAHSLDKSLASTQARLTEVEKAYSTTQKNLENRLKASEVLLLTLRADLDAEKKALGASESKIQVLKIANEKDANAANDKIELLKSMRADMQQKFKELADETLLAHGKAMSDSNQKNLVSLLAPLKENVDLFQKELRSVHTDATKERELLKAEITQLTTRSEKISQDAVNLTKALRGDKQRQGAWGEMILTNILERSGLREGEEYQTQAHRTDEDGNRYRPDVVVHLPGDKNLVVDSKVSLVDYEKAVNAETEAERNLALSAHVNAVKTHIKTLSDKGYQNLESGSVDYVVMFMPIEGALSEALRHQGDLTSYALERGITIATPTTLMMALRTVEHVWSVERRNQNAEEIADRAGKLYDKVYGFLQDMEKVGERLKQTEDAYTSAMGKLEKGRGNVLSQVEKLKSLGAKTGKSLGPNVIADDDPLAIPDT